MPILSADVQGVDLNYTSSSSKWSLEGHNIIEALSFLSQLALLG